ncbi:Arm DNA-binding domain-containing protein [Parvibaculum sp.]|uniref:Arm DNA-binding domain-containing protein n=1 Tax=Parvibaculum sp. TaxID=2024848 RepID=UPI000C8FF4FD|nr:integrase [Parvibaculum sp.]
MPLTDVAVRTAKPRSKACKLSDGAGLFLLVATKGQRYWRYEYRFGGRRKSFALGVYPDVLLAQAREAHRVARKAVVRGEDPGS